MLTKLAAFVEFKNEDGRWAPGERRLYRTVQPDVGCGRSIGFIGHADNPVVLGILMEISERTDVNYLR